MITISRIVSPFRLRSCTRMFVTVSVLALALCVRHACASDLVEDFSAPLGPEWMVIDEGDRSAPSDWEVTGGELVQWSNIYRNDITSAALPKEGTYLLYGDGLMWSDVAVNWVQRSYDNDALGLMFRYLDNDNYYRYSVDLERGYRRLVKKTAGEYRLIAWDWVPYEAGVSQQVRIEAVGDLLRVYVDGQVVFEVNDPDHAAGTIAFYCWGNEGARFDDLVVEDLSGGGPPDTIAPGPVTNLRADSPTANSIRVRWTASGDDGDLYRASAYDLRWSLAPITTISEFDAAVMVPDLPDPLTSGAEQEKRVTGLPSSSDIYFAMRTVDDAGNLSELAAGAWSHTLDQEYLFDDFEDGAPDGFSFVDEPGTWYGPGSWDAAVGSLIQYSGIKGYQVETSGYPLGTYATWDGGWGLSDVFIRAELYSPPFGLADNDRDIGIVFRYQGPNNFYRFSMDRARGRRLVAKIGGDYVTLAADTSVYDLDRVYEVEVIAVGSRFLVRLDGETILAAEDSTLATGTAGVFSSYNEGARFDEIVIASVPDGPMVGTVSPTSFSVIEQNDLVVSALVTDPFYSGGVRFTLDPTVAPVSQIVTAPPFEAWFGAIGTGEHEILVEAYDTEAGGPITCERCSQYSTMIGIGGIHLVAFGDSITRGEEDDDQSDFFSADWRNDGVGYTPVLNNWLTSWEQRPQTVVKDAYDGFEADEALMVLPDAMAKNPGASIWLVLFGTNDSFAGRSSGLGLYPGAPGYYQSYKYYMQKIIDQIIGSGAAAVLGKVPFSSRSWFDDPLVQEYNQVIEELYAANGLPGYPPDFYTPFKADPDNLLTSNGLHPSGLGYRVMARLWYDALTALVPGLPDAPSQPAAVPAAGGIRLDWSSIPAGADGYHVWRRLDPSALFERITVASVPGTSFLDESVESGVFYTYVITAVLDGTEGPYSDEVTATAP